MGKKSWEHRCGARELRFLAVPPGAGFLPPLDPPPPPNLQIGDSNSSLTELFWRLRKMRHYTPGT